MVHTFNIIPASSTPMIFIAAISLILVLVIGLFVFIGYSARNTKFEVSEQGLHIKGSIYGRFIPRGTINAENIQIVNLNIQEPYQPRIKTNGTGLPGYAEGWFKLKNKEKALLFVTDRSNVVYIPTEQGYSVLLSVSQPEEFRQTTELWK